MTNSSLYTFSGYSPHDGLGEGRWVPDKWGVLKWVGELEAVVATTQICPSCPAVINLRAVRCQSCARTLRDQRLAEKAALDLLACPSCPATVGKHCQTSTGRHRAPHPARLVARRCPCGGALDKGKKMCDSCRADARRENGRKAMQNTRARRREAA